MNLSQREKNVVMQTYGRFDIVLDHGKGAVVWDDQGKPYIDLTAGIGVNALGHGYEPLVQAVCDQARSLMQASNLYYTKPMVEAAEKLTARTGMTNVFFANSGAEANEGAIKIARKYSTDKYGKERTKILTLKNSFHGRTVATLEATGQDKFHRHFFPFTDGFAYIEPNDPEDFKTHADDTVCAVIMELVQGESGVRPLDKAYVQAVRAICEEKDILFIVDEVQTGMGRTGTLFCWEQYGIVPDLFTTAKALAGGVPAGAVISGPKTARVLQAGDHGTTFGGNPLACAAANVVLDTIDEPFLEQVRKKGDKMMASLKDIQSPLVKDVRGMGLMIGVQVDEDTVGPLLARMQEKGILPLKAGRDTIRLLPPLVISEDQIDQAVEIMKEVLTDETFAEDA